MFLAERATALLKAFLIERAKQDREAEAMLCGFRIAEAIEQERTKQIDEYLESLETQLQTAGGD